MRSLLKHEKLASAVLFCLNCIHIRYCITSNYGCRIEQKLPEKPISSLFVLRRRNRRRSESKADVRTAVLNELKLRRRNRRRFDFRTDVRTAVLNELKLRRRNRRRFKSRTDVRTAVLNELRLRRRNRRRIKSRTDARTAGPASSIRKDCADPSCIGIGYWNFNYVCLDRISKIWP